MQHNLFTSVFVVWCSLYDPNCWLRFAPLPVLSTQADAYKIYLRGRVAAKTKTESGDMII